MKIDSTYNPATAQITSRSAARPSQEPSAAASVSLSQLASTMQGTEKPPVNAARIQEIKEAIASGAFHLSKPSDLIPELQGRFPIRVELQSLSVEDFVAILTSCWLLPQNEQYSSRSPSPLEFLPTLKTSG